MAEKTASLTVLGGPFAGTRCALPETGVLTIGSAEDATVRLDLPTVCPYHARIEVEAGRVTVHETGADRPLHVNDNPLDPGGTVLRNGDILWLGSPGEDEVVMLQCVLPRRAVELPPPAEPPAPPAEPPAEPELHPTLSGPVVPTPEVETQALWSFSDDALAPPRVAAEPVPEGPTGQEETTAIVSDGLVEAEVEPSAEPVEPAEAPEVAPDVVPEATTAEDALVFTEPTLAGASEDEVSAAVDSGEEVVFVEATEAEIAASEVSPTILMASEEEMAGPPPAIDFVEDIVPAPEPVLAPPSIEGEAVFAPEPLEEPALQPLPPAAPPAPAPPPLPAPPAPPVPVPPAAAKPAGAAPPLPAARPAAPARPSAARPASRPPRPAPHAPAPRPRPAPEKPARPAPVPPAAGEPEADEPAPARAGGQRSILLGLAGAGGALVLVGAAWVGWRLLAQPSAPRPTPAPVVRATVAPPALPSPTVVPVAVEPTPEAVAPTPAAPTPLPTPTPAGPARATPSPAPTPTPRTTPTPRATPTPAAVRATPTPPPGPSAEALAAQQRAAEAQSLLGQAEAAFGAKQFDAAVSHLDGVLRLDPANARATALRADAVRRRDLARRRFAPGKTVVQGQKTGKAGGLAGFDTGDADLRSSDFLGRVEFEMSPASGIEPGDAWTLQVYVVNEGKKAIRLNGLVLGTTVNGAGSGGPLPARAREIAPQQRSLVAETKGTWAEGTSSWVAEVTVTGAKGETLKNTLSWR